jgi:hypothetical protein
MFRYYRYSLSSNESILLSFRRSTSRFRSIPFGRGGASSFIHSLTHVLAHSFIHSFSFFYSSTPSSSSSSARRRSRSARYCSRWAIFSARAVVFSESVRVLYLCLKALRSFFHLCFSEAVFFPNIPNPFLSGDSLSLSEDPRVAPAIEGVAIETIAMTRASARRRQLQLLL